MSPIDLAVPFIFSSHVLRRASGPVRMPFERGSRAVPGFNLRMNLSGNHFRALPGRGLKPSAMVSLLSVHTGAV